MSESFLNTCACLRTVCNCLFARSKDSGEQHDTGYGRAVTQDRCKSNKDEEAKKDLDPGDTGNVSFEESAIYMALWSFEARSEEELSFQKGDIFRVIDRSGDWWTVQKLDRNNLILSTGFVPYNYLGRRQSIEAEPWYFGKMNRFEASKHLRAPWNGDGAFLLRFSENDRIGYVLSVKVNDCVKHFIIYQDDGQFYIDPKQCFASLVDMVEFYKSHPIMTVVKELRAACKRKEPIPHDLSYATVDEWELPKEEFTLEKLLGSGYFAEVYKGKWRNRITVAIKVLKNNKNPETHQDFQSDFQRESQILKKLRHRNLITLYAVCSLMPPYYIVTELMENGNLLDFLRGSEGQDLDQGCLTDMATQVAEGMAYLESQNSIHRDLAARNVLVGENYNCKVADFGLARIIKEPFYLCKEIKIPYKWCAPEAISHGRYSIKSDVWSFGILLYEVFSGGGNPYPGCDNQEVFQLITTGYRMPAPHMCPDYIYKVMLSCWQAAPEDRPSFNSLKVSLENRYGYELN